MFMFLYILTYHNFSIQSKDLLHRHMTNSGNWILTVGTYLHNGCKDRNYFLHFKRIGTNLQNGYKDRDQNAYSLQNRMKIFIQSIDFGAWNAIVKGPFTPTK